MIVYRYNKYTNRYYFYDLTEDYTQYETPAFDNAIHNNDITPDIDDPLTCAYCNTCFTSRNKLFYHLEYHDINTKFVTDISLHREDDKLGDEGVAFTRRIMRRLDRVNKRLAGKSYKKQKDRLTRLDEKRKRMLQDFVFQHDLTTSTIGLNIMDIDKPAKKQKLMNSEERDLFLSSFLQKNLCIL